MSRNKRKSPRQPLKAIAYLYSHDGWPLGECTLRDISATGAQLVLATDEELPKVLLLSLSRDGRVRRRCELIWRNGERIGVHFRGDQASLQK